MSVPPARGVWKEEVGKEERGREGEVEKVRERERGREGERERGRRGKKEKERKGGGKGMEQRTVVRT